MITQAAVEKMRPEAFEAFVMLPENEDRRLELPDGEVIELVSHLSPSEIAVTISAYIRICLMQNLIGRLTGANGGYRVGKHRFMPDVGYISYARLPSPPEEAWTPLPPELAIEVISPSDDERKVTKKIHTCLSAGVVVWSSIQ